jgi:fructokinase
VSRAQRPVVVGIGEVLWDLLPSGKQFGGAPANFAYHAHALGAESHVVSCVGKDVLGGEIVDRLAALNLSRQYIAVDEAHPTGTVSVALDGQGKPTYTIHEGVAWDFIPSSAELLDLAGRTDAVCFGSLAQRSDVSRRTIRAFLAAVPRQALKVFDINLRQHYFDLETVRAGLASADVLKLNDEELPVVAGLLGISETDAVGWLLAEFGLKLIALTRGPQGAVLATPQGRSALPAAATAVVDTVGAGDAFTAALAMGLLDGRDLDAIHRHAHRLAAFVCSQPGATPPVPAALAEC